MKYYIPINSVNLVHYFAKALIVPVKYIDNRNQDLQNILSNHILLSKSKFVKTSDCVIEVYITNNELDGVDVLDDNFSIYNSILPISRIVSVVFFDERQMKTTVWNIQSGSAYIPEHLLKLCEFEEKDSVSFTVHDRIEIVTKSLDLQYEVREFDEKLGGLALLKIGGANYTNYSANYFSFLSYFDDDVKKDYLKTKRTLNHKFNAFFNDKAETALKILPHIGETISNADVISIGVDEKLDVKSKFGLIDLESIPTSSYVYTLAILATYGSNQPKSIDDFIDLILSNTFVGERREGLTLTFGLHNGYSAFRNKYKIRNIEKDIKFKLDSLLDYHTIESVYQRIFNKNLNKRELHFLEDIAPRKVNNVSDFKTFRILDVEVIEKKILPVDGFEYLEKLQDDISNKTIIQNTARIILDIFPCELYKDTVTADIEELFSKNLKKDFDELIQIVRDRVLNDKNEYELKQSEKKATQSNSNNIETKKVIKEDNSNKTISQEVKSTNSNTESHNDLHTIESLGKLTIPKLSAIAKKQNKKVRSNMKKAEIIDLILSRRIDNNLFNG